ncbi:hypothetical protein ABH923_003635 [Leifsonia sp. EB41]
MPGGGGGLGEGEESGGLGQADGAGDEQVGAEGARCHEREHPRVVGGRHPVAAEEVQFPGDRAVQRQHRHPAGKQADLHVPAAAAQRQRARGRRLGRAHRVDRDVRAAGGQGGDGLGRVRAGRDGVLGAEACGRVERVGRAVDGDRAGAECAGDRDGAQPDAARAVDRDPLAGPQHGARGQSAVGGREPAAEGGRGGVREAVGHRHQVEVGRPHSHELGVRAPVCEAGLGLLRAHLRLPRPAPLARAAAVDERRRDPVAGPPALDTGPDRLHDAGELVTRDVRQPHRVVVARPGVPVAPAEPGRADADERPAVRQLGRGEVADPDRAGERLVVQCLHRVSSSTVAAAASSAAAILPSSVTTGRSASAHSRPSRSSVARHSSAS